MANDKRTPKGPPRRERVNNTNTDTVSVLTMSVFWYLSNSESAVSVNNINTDTVSVLTMSVFWYGSSDHQSSTVSIDKIIPILTLSQY
jgi:hypothetical protein